LAEEEGLGLLGQLEHEKIPDSLMEEIEQTIQMFANEGIEDDLDALRKFYAGLQTVFTDFSEHSNPLDFPNTTTMLMMTVRRIIRRKEAIKLPKACGIKA
jgi:hypothetical protein